MSINSDIKAQISRVNALSERAAKLPGGAGIGKYQEMKHAVHDALRILSRGDIIAKTEILDKLAAFD